MPRRVVASTGADLRPDHRRGCAEPPVIVWNAHPQTARRRAIKAATLTRCCGWMEFALAPVSDDGRPVIPSRMTAVTVTAYRAQALLPAGAEMEWCHFELNEPDQQDAGAE